MSFFDKNDFKMTRKGIIPLKAWNNLVDLIFALSVQSVGSQLLMRRGVDGTSLSVKRMAGGGGGGLAQLPLLIKLGSEAGKFQISDGRVNTQSPTLGGVVIGGDPDADPVVPPPEFTVTADVWVYVKVVGTFSAPDTYVVTIDQQASDEPPAEVVSASGFTSYNIIGKVVFTSGAPDSYSIENYHGGGNMGIESFGSVNLWWVIR